MLIELTALSAQDDLRLTDYTSMTDVNLRKSLEVERGLYMAESTNVIIRALEAGHRPRSLIMAPRWLPDLEPLLEHFLGAADGGDTPVFIAPEELLESITGFHLHRGALAAMQRPTLQPVSDLLDSLGKGPKRVLILEDLVDHTNVGAAFRSAAALGADAVLVTPQCADPLYRRWEQFSKFHGPESSIGQLRKNSTMLALRLLHSHSTMSRSVSTSSLPCT